MAKKTKLTPELRRRKRTIGIIAVVLLLIFTILALLQYISLIEWLIADLVVGLIANLLLRRIGR
jgi:ABC-type transporter Mla maintaining outer membrane lipid asymmetry permease subunit MlaE